MRRYYAENRERILANSKRWHDEHPLAAKAYGILRAAIEKGEVVIPNACEKCGAKVALESHHEDYSKPLEVRWLCLSCHKVLHRKRVAVR
jgi:ribosomal protein S27AE